MMTTMKNLLTEVNKAGTKADYTEFTYMLGVKLALIQHALLHGTDQLRDEELGGISYLIGEIQEGLSQMGEYCQTAQEYFYYLNDPKRLAEIQKIES